VYSKRSNAAAQGSRKAAHPSNPISRPEGGSPRRARPQERARRPRAARGAAPVRAVRPPPARREARRSGPAAIESPSTLAARWPDVRPILDRQPWDSLIPHLLKVGASPDHAVPRLRRYCELVIQWNRKVSNLISRNDEPRIVSRHLLESLEPAHWLQSSGADRWLDFGSGGGLPAIPLAIAGVGGNWTLVESRRTKTLFLRKVLEELEISSMTVVLARLEDLIGLREHAFAYNGFTSRATLPLAPTLSMAASMVRPGGAAFLWKGSKREAEMAADPNWQVNWDFDGLLGIGDGTTAVARFARK